MDHHKSLYKDHRFCTPRIYSKRNRELQETNRNKQRMDRFQNARNISPSPSCYKKEIIIPLCPEGEESANNVKQKQNLDSTRLAKIVCDATNAEKLTKQEAFIKRFVEWKENKKKLRTQEANKKKPFISAVSSGSKTTFGSLVPTGHHKGFRPPIGLKNHVSSEKTEEHTNSIKQSNRQSIYTVVPTPPRKKSEEKCAKKLQTVKTILPNNLNLKVSSSKKLPNSVINLLKNDTKPIVANKLNGKTPGDKKPIVGKTPSTKSTVKVVAVNLGHTENMETKADTSSKPTVRRHLRPRALKMPPPLPVKKPVETSKSKQIGSTAKGGAETQKRNEILTQNKNTATNKQTGAIAKIKAMPEKSREVTKQTKNSSLKSCGAHLAQNLKAKKPLSSSRKVNASVLQANSKKIVALLKNNQTIEDMFVQTPRDFATFNTFSEFVTSTTIKESSHIIENVEGKSSTEISSKQSHRNSSVKRNLMQETANTTVVENEKNITGIKETYQCDTNITKENGIENVIKKYNFIRYSAAPDHRNDNDKLEEEELNALSDNTKKSETHTQKEQDKNGTQCILEKTPTNYLSPYVSVTRGKVSLKKEKERRNSIYLQKGGQAIDLPTDNVSQSSPKFSVENRRTLEAVRYFRKQLQDEIDRLHQLCDIWEVYKQENLEKIQNANGEDMINVTIGQTRLLTSKKFMQFKSLIDRCEAGVTGIGAIEYDGSEDTKPITAVDLEGFWSMVSLQVDNLDKRFENLNRWKLNDWKDPDELKPKIKKNLTKVKKAKPNPAIKAKPNSALQQMLRKMQAEARLNKKKNEDNGKCASSPFKSIKRYSENSNNSSPRKSLDTSASRHFSIVVKDRKYFSPVATVLSVSSINRKTNKVQREPSQDSPKMLKHLKSFNEALNIMETSLSLRKSVLINENSRRMSSNSYSSEGDVKIEDRKTLSGTVDANKENCMDGSNLARLPSPSAKLSPMPSARKSILKTPGTAKSRLRNVIFNEKLYVKKFNFLMTEKCDSFNAENEDVNHSHEEDLSKSQEEEQHSPQRTLYLRNRKVRLRPSSEIIIPQKE